MKFKSSLLLDILYSICLLQKKIVEPSKEKPGLLFQSVLHAPNKATSKFYLFDWKEKKKAYKDTDFKSEYGRVILHRNIDLL